MQRGDDGYKMSGDDRDDKQGRESNSAMYGTATGATATGQQAVMSGRSPNSGDVTTKMGGLMAT